jgi:hypothetical protein
MKRTKSLDKIAMTIAIVVLILLGLVIIAASAALTICMLLISPFLAIGFWGVVILLSWSICYLTYSSY